MSDPTIETVVRRHAEQQFAAELQELTQSDERQRPPNWQLSPWAVRTYILGGTLPNSFVVSPKYIGNARLVEIAVATLATDRALLLYGLPGTAKCVKHDTLVLDIKSGQRITIAEACRRKEIEIASLQANYKLHPQTPTEYLDNGVRPCYRVKTQLGREIEVTINHPFLTIEGWQPLEKLAVGNRIALPRHLSYFGDGTLSDAHVKILAHLIAEGCLTQGLPYYTNTNQDMQQDFSEAVKTAFPELEAHWYPDGQSCSVSGGRRGRYAINPCTQWLKDLGIMGADSASKFVPEIIFTLPKRQIALFLNRLFSGDGFLHFRSTKKQVTVDYSSKSKRLIMDVQHLLLRFGINARVCSTNNGRHYRLFIHGTQQSLTFLQEIGLIGRKYVEEALQYLSDPAIQKNPNVDVIPHQVWFHLEKLAITAEFTGVSAVVRRDRRETGKRRVKVGRATVIRGQGISRSRLSRLAQIVQNDDLRHLAESDIYWDAIISIEPIGEHQVYDLSIADTHNFVANDIIVHNSWMSEHLAAAITGDSTLLIQGTAGTDESALRYGWNYARLLTEGPSLAALVVSPMMRAMRDGKIARVEELTRIPAEVQDTLITILSEKTLPVPELSTEVQAHKGFNVIATANNRDKGVNELSSALTRRFNTVILPLPATMEEEVDIVERRVASLGQALELPAEKPALAEIRRVVTIFRELRDGTTSDGQTRLKSPSGTLSTAEAISVVNNGLAMAAYFGDGVLHAGDLAAGMTGAIVKDPVQDRLVWQEYLQTVVKERDGWKDLYRACNEVL